MLVESLLLASIGGALGIAVGYWGKQLLPGRLGQAAPLDWRVLAFVAVVTAVTGLLFGIAPALRATRADVSSVLKETSRSVVGIAQRCWASRCSSCRWRSRSCCSIGAGLFLRTLDNLRAVDVGFDPTQPGAVPRQPAAESATTSSERRCSISR